jgi:hypothetical protein
MITDPWGLYPGAAPRPAPHDHRARPARPRRGDWHRIDPAAGDFRSLAERRGQRRSGARATLLVVSAAASLAAALAAFR